MKQFLLLSFCLLLSTLTQAQTLESNDWLVYEDGFEWGTVRFGNGDFSISFDGENFEVFSTYTSTSNAFVITDLPDSGGGCDDVPGSYSYIISGDILNFTEVDDPCDDRALVIADGVWQNVNSITSTTEIEEESNFSIYPNPVLNTLNIEVDESSIGASYSVLSIDGRVINTDLINSTATRIDMSGLPAGIYLVQYGEQAAAQRFVKQ